MPINVEWHNRNKMPERATLEQRIRWHKAHALHCACRKMPDGWLEAMEARLRDSKLRSRSAKPAKGSPRGGKKA